MGTYVDQLEARFGGGLKAYELPLTDHVVVWDGTTRWVASQDGLPAALEKAGDDYQELCDHWPCYHSDDEIPPAVEAEAREVLDLDDDDPITRL